MKKIALKYQILPAVVSHNQSLEYLSFHSILMNQCFALCLVCFLCTYDWWLGSQWYRMLWLSTIWVLDAILGSSFRTLPVSTLCALPNGGGPHGWVFFDAPRCLFSDHSRQVDRNTRVLIICFRSIYYIIQEGSIHYIIREEIFWQLIRKELNHFSLNNNVRMIMIYQLPCIKYQD